ncbi:hypothetical protein D6_0260 [Aeromonas phage D6]|uniref:Uncharacterized protein n=1 Tax=Aeromonas phage D6 TaxID=2593322 RepID=A0A7G7XLL0_9CAUD|nr:hypothetical protein PQC08_gp015 [Aeromonas phage D6]QNH80855.1 hypothetical protein D6_0260 [Aeromonas phage D6]
MEGDYSPSQFKGNKRMNNQLKSTCVNLTNNFFFYKNENGVVYFSSYQLSLDGFLEITSDELYAVLDGLDHFYLKAEIIGEVEVHELVTETTKAHATMSGHKHVIADTFYSVW